MPTSQNVAPTPRSAPPFAASRYCWVSDSKTARNQFVSFELRLHVAEPASAFLYLFADTRYRLFVNELFVAYGPARFTNAHPEFDTHDLGPWLEPGDNRIRVEVNFYGCSSFQTSPGGRPGFIADGSLEDGSVSFETPGRWCARIHRAWDENSPLFSFAQNPAEICDTRVLASELTSSDTVSLIPLDSREIPWGKLRPRSAPYPDYFPQYPPLLSVAGILLPTHCWGVQLRHSGFEPDLRRIEPTYVAFSTWIKSPRDQQVTMDCFWSDLEFGGIPLEIEYPGRLGNHGETRLELREGWNFLSGTLQILEEHWPLLLGFPEDAAVSLHACPHDKEGNAFALSPPRRGSRPEVPAIGSPDRFRLPANWCTVPSDLASVTPARLVAWGRLQPGAIRQEVLTKDGRWSSSLAGREVLWCFDFADEYYGQPFLEVEAPEGTILDLSYDDWKRADGCVNLYHSNPFVHATDRFVLRGGRQRIEVLNPRGGIFLQVTMRAPDGTELACFFIHDIGIRRRTTIKSIDGSFSCGDSVLDWVWKAAAHTLEASTDEAYSDCPWRERSSYIGDSLANLHIHRLISTDLSVPRRTLELFGSSAFPNGQLPSCAPSWIRHHHGDFTLLWIQAVYDYWACTGDREFVSSQWHVIERILTMVPWVSDELGLWNSTKENLFVDWGIVRAHREGRGNACLNIFRVAALRAAGQLAGILGKLDFAERFAEDAKRTADAIAFHLWNQEKGCFNISLDNPNPGLHASILALRYGIGIGEALIAYLEPELRANFRLARGMTEPEQSVVELYFFHFLLPALAAQEKHDLACDLIRETYGFVRSLGYPTLPENFRQADGGRGSCCHSWSGSPAPYATRHILGLHQACPGYPDAFVLNPQISFESCSGTFPHPLGEMRIRWKRHGSRIRAIASLPKGVTLTPAAHIDLQLEGVTPSKIRVKAPLLPYAPLADLSA